MSSQQGHEARCIDVLGQPWPVAHRWLDQYFYEVTCLAHRIILHHRAGIELGVAELGEEARAALELHVKDDLGEILPGPLEVAAAVFDRGFAIYPAWPATERLWPELAKLGKNFGFCV